MQRLTPDGPARTRLLVFVPRWREATETFSGMPYRVFSTLDPLLRAGYAVDLVLESDGDHLEAAMDGAAALICWCAELHPGLQLPGLTSFLAASEALAGHVPRLVGGGFFTYEAARELELPGDVRAIHSSENGALVAAVARALGHPPQPERQTMGIDALLRVDLRPFARPEPHLLGNDRPALQLPTGLGCGKRCPFCFYENHPMRLVPGRDIVRAVAHARTNFGIDQFLMGDLDFFCARRRVLDIVDGLLRLRRGIRWFALGSVQDVLACGDDELRRARRSGLVCVELGTEAGSDRSLASLGKKFTRADAQRVNRRLTAVGITPLHNILLGWPGETAEDRATTLDLVGTLHAESAGRARFNFRRYQPIPGTTMGDRVLANTPPIPTDLTELRDYRLGGHRRDMPWLDSRSETEIARLTDLILPLAYDPGPHLNPRPSLQRTARLRCRVGEHPMLDRCLDRGSTALALPRTYQP